MSKDRQQFLKELKNDIETLTPYKSGYSMSDILAIKYAFNDLVNNLKADSIYNAVKRFYSKKKYSNNIIVINNPFNNGYRVMF